LSCKTMKLLCLLLVFCSVVFGKDEGGDAKLKFMFNKAASSSNGLIDNLTKSEFRKHVANGPRTYHVLLFLTVLGPDSSCKICGQVHEAAGELAQQLKGVRKLDDSDHVFILEVDYTSSSSIISELGLDRVPQVVLVPKTKSSRSIALSDLLDSLGQKYSYSMMLGYKGEDFVNFINKAAKMELNLTRPVNSFEVCMFVFAIVAALAIIIASWSFIDKIRRHMFLYAIVGVLFYCFCIGGGMYCIIRNTPWSGGSKSKPEYIQKGGRNQYTVEGYLMGAANLVGGIGVFLYVMQNKASTNTDSRQDAALRLFKYVPSVVALGLIFFSWYSILNVYNTKSPHYKMGFVGMTG